MIGIMFFVVGLILVIIGVRMSFARTNTQLKAGESISQINASGNGLGNIITYIGYGCWLIAILYGFGILGGQTQAEPMAGGRRRRR